MAPEFFPFLAFIGLAVLAVIGLGVGLVFVFCGAPKLLSALAFSGVATAALLLLLLGVSIRQQYFLNEPLVCACGSGDLAEAQRLLSRGASPDSYGIDFIETALIAASRSGHGEIVQLLVRSGANVALQDSRGRTALRRAKEAGYSEIVSVLEQPEKPQ